MKKWDVKVHKSEFTPNTEKTVHFITRFSISDNFSIHKSEKKTFQSDILTDFV